MREYQRVLQRRKAILSPEWRARGRWLWSCALSRRGAVNSRREHIVAAGSKTFHGSKLDSQRITQNGVTFNTFVGGGYGGAAAPNPSAVQELSIDYSGVSAAVTVASPPGLWPITRGPVIVRLLRSTLPIGCARY